MQDKMGRRDLLDLHPDFTRTNTFFIILVLKVILKWYCRENIISRIQVNAKHWKWQFSWLCLLIVSCISQLLLRDKQLQNLSGFRQQIFMLFFTCLWVIVALLDWVEVNSMGLLVSPWVFCYTQHVLLMTGHVRARGWAKLYRQLKPLFPLGLLYSIGQSKSHSFTQSQWGQEATLPTKIPMCKGW